MFRLLFANKIGAIVESAMAWSANTRIGTWVGDNFRFKLLISKAEVLQVQEGSYETGDENATTRACRRACYDMAKSILDKPEMERNDAERAILEKYEAELEYNRNKKEKERADIQSILDKILDKPEEQRDDAERAVLEKARSEFGVRPNAYGQRKGGY
jgi:CRISPR/Cas system CSM-associated protein Csm2 small subunit